jgi:MFS family permease
MQNVSSNERSKPVEKRVFQAVTGADEPPSANEARNGLCHVLSLSMTKIADGLIDPKLVLSWLLTAIGAPAVLVGLLVPIREAGALLPQVLFAPRVARMPIRKWVWAAGSAVQGLAAAAICLVALQFSGAAAGVLICASVAILAVARSACSVSYKDILGKTVAKTRRGAVTGAAASVSAVGVMIFAGLLILEGGRSQTIVLLAIALASVLWLAAAAVFTRIEEERSDSQPEGASVDFSILRRNPNLTRFIAARGLLVSTALAPPYLVILNGTDGELSKLGALVLASGLASLVSSWTWGRAADKSSRRVLMRSGVIGALGMLCAVALSLAGFAQGLWAIPVVLFSVMIAYHGVRQGRSTYLVDIAPEHERANWTAVANTVIGVLLLAVGAFGGVLSFLGPEAVLVLFGALSLAAAGVARGLTEAE